MHGVLAGRSRARVNKYEITNSGFFIERNCEESLLKNEALLSDLTRDGFNDACPFDTRNMYELFLTIRLWVGWKAS